MANWPTWELTHVHRQQGVNNSIVDNAHRILKGLRPISDSPKPLKLKDKESAIDTLKWMLSDKDWRFAMIEVDEASTKAGAYIREMLKLLKNAKFYDPNRDAVITAINGYDTGQVGFALGQDTMNRELSRSEEHTSELQSLMRISYAVFCLKKKNKLRTIVTVTNT